MINNDAVGKLRGGLIVSCQAPRSSPLHDSIVIRAMALAAEQNGAVGVRINSFEHTLATKQVVTVPIIGIEKVETVESMVYITPTFREADKLSQAGADIIAIDSTRRPRPRGERLEDLIRRIKKDLQKPVMADISTVDEALFAADCGADIIATTLCGYTNETKGLSLPAFDLILALAPRLNLPVICEGGLATPEQVKMAFNFGAFAVVVGAAITGIDQAVRRFVSATLQNSD